MKHRLPKQIHAVKGFTLIEFLVASMLAMIVILAASGTYLITRKLNSTTQERISTQQDIRNASVQMARDARMAGSFGCFSTGDNEVKPPSGGAKAFNIKAKNSAAENIVSMNSANKDGYGVRLIPSGDLSGLTGLSNPSDGLLFIYGQSATAAMANDSNGLINTSGSADVNALIFSSLKTDTVQDKSDSLYQTLQNGGDIVVSTCSVMHGSSATAFNDSTGQANINTISNMQATQYQNGEFNVSKLNASLYVLGDINRGTQRTWANEKALLRYDLGADGTWSSPQLLATGINDTDNTGMTFNFGYVDESAGKCSPTSTETFTFVSNPSAAPNNVPPALVQVRLKYYTNKPKSDSVDADAQTRDYIINTTVRSGNACANRLVSGSSATATSASGAATGTGGTGTGSGTSGSTTP